MAKSINARGQIVGFAQTGSGASHPALFEGGQVIDLSAHPNGTFTVANGIKNSGQIVGQMTTLNGAAHAALCTPDHGKGNQK